MANKKPAKRIPIKAAQRIAQDYGQDQVIVLTWNRTDGKSHVVTYGRTLLDCDQAAQGGNNIKQRLGWPDELCHVVPARARERQNKSDGWRCILCGGIVSSPRVRKDRRHVTSDSDDCGGSPHMSHDSPMRSSADLFGDDVPDVDPQTGNQNWRF